MYFVLNKYCIIPKNRGFLIINSAIIQPTPHISTPKPYFYIPSITSGGRYHLAATYCVITF